jgi:hypothetical protein
VGGYEIGASVSVESSLRYHPCYIGFLTQLLQRVARTLSGGQFDWGGRLLKSNGGAQRFPQHGWKPCVECKSIRKPDCETDKSSRAETRV